MADEKEEAEAVARAAKVRAEVGHPQERWNALAERIQGNAIKKFSDVSEEWLELIWCLDFYKAGQAPPDGMGKADKPWGKRLDAAYRGKGDWFSTLLLLLLDNRTGEKLRSRGAIKGFSQNHQIDLAWPDRKVAPVICAESKISGGPPYWNTPARSAHPDWSNRRKELKFAATDLKLGRRDQSEEIGHWNVWRKNALPKYFVLWAARLAPGDSFDKMIREAEAVLATYLDGAGVVAWRERSSGVGYELVPHPAKRPGQNVVELDDALWQIESEIKTAKKQGLHEETPPFAAPLDTDSLSPDEES